MAAPLKPIARRALAAQSDDRLVRLLREGHEPAFDEIVRRYRGPLVAFAAAIAGASRAEDVVQASLMRAHGALGADEREIRLRPWLFAIVRNGALNAVRDEPAWSELDPEQQGERRAAATAEQREELERLVDAICALPESQRQALVMREMEGVGHAEIAAKLQTSPTAVRGLIFRARTTLRNALGALVPLPVLRWLLEDAAVAAAAGAAGGAGAAGAGGSALLGGAFGKAAVGLTAAVVAVGAGKAIQDRRGDDRQATGPEVARAATGPGAGSRDSPGGSGSGPGGATGDERREAARESAEERSELRSGAGEEAREAREDRRDDRGDRRDDRGDRRDDTRDSDDGHSGHSGSAGGSSGSSGSGGGGGHSGSGGSDDDGGDEVDDDDRVEPEEPDEPDEPEELDDEDDDDDGGDHSGPGPGGDDDD